MQKICKTEEIKDLVYRRKKTSDRKHKKQEHGS